MVKANDKGAAAQESGPPSSMASDGSFVILERSAAQPPNGEQSLQGSIALPPSSLAQHTRESLSSSYIPGSNIDLSPEEIQKKLREVLQENVELKETLHQNNLAMKQQFNTLVMWQDEVFKVHQTHKEKFQETKELILKLRAENAELKNYLEMKAGNSDIQLKAENARLKGQVVELQQKLSAPMPRRDSSAASATPSKKEEELSELVKQLNGQLETAERARRQLTMEAESLGARRERAEREVTALRAELVEVRRRAEEAEARSEELASKMHQCEQDLRSYIYVDDGGNEKDSEQIQHLRGKLESALAQVEDLKSQLDLEKEMKERVKSQAQKHVAAVQEQMRKMQEAGGTAEVSGPKQGFAASASSFEEKLQELDASLAKQTDRYASVDKWLQSAAASLQPWRPSGQTERQALAGLKADIADLQKVLAQEQGYGQEKREFLEATQERLRQLLSDQEVLRRQWEAHSQDQKARAQHDDAYHDLQAKGFSEKMDRLMAEVLCKDEEIKENEREIKEMKERSRKLELENEAIAILKAQVEVYQSDFTAEREAREALAGERERLSEDLRHLQRRNQQLLDEVETLQRSQFDQMQAATPSANSGWSTIATPGRASAQAAQAGDRNQRPSPDAERNSPPRNGEAEVSEADVQRFYCPKCEQQFRLLEPLQQHVEVCLELTP